MIFHSYVSLPEGIPGIFFLDKATFQQNHVSNVGHINVTQVAFLVDRAITEACPDHPTSTRKLSCSDYEWKWFQWSFQEPKLEVPTISKALVSGNIPTKYSLIWYSTSILGS